MNKVTISAKNLELALVKAAGELSVSRSEVAHRVREQSQGFLGLGRKVTIQAWPRHSSSSSSHRNGAHARKRRSEPKEMSEDLETEVIMGLKTFLHTIIKLAFHIDCEISTVTDVSLEGKRVIFEVHSEQFAQILKEEVMLADAIEHLLRKQPRHIKRELPFKIFVDAQSSRLSREKDILAHAKQASDKVVKTGDSVVLDYESSYDRKMIHLALHHDQRVFTKSIGHGPRKKLMISLSDRA